MSLAVAKRPNQLSFESAEAMIFDPIAANRTTTRTALSMLGFRQVVATSVFSELGQLINGRALDLLVADVTHEPVKTCSFVRAIREGKSGANPFMHIVLMAWKLEGDIVKGALNCGADDLVARPFSVEFLGARIRTHAEARKPFVVTSDYIGPDRRRAGSQRSSANLFTVPNTLYTKARDPNAATRTTATLDEIKSASLVIDAERARRDAFQISFLIHFLREALGSMAPIEDDLGRLENATKDLIARVTGTENESVTQTTAPLLEAVAGAQSGENVAAHIQKMDELSKTLLQSMYADRDAADLAKEVQAAVEIAKTRGRKG
jgi:DNA-binding response OmpR family regulator